MPQEKQMMDQKLEEKKLEKPVEKEKIVEVPKVEKPKVPASEKPIHKDDKSLDNKKKDKKASIRSGPKKTDAVVNGKDLKISRKHAVAICNYIKNKDIDVAMDSLFEVGKMKKAIPMKGEIPHRKGMMSGRYPLKAVAEFIRLLKSLKANAIANELELEKFKLFCVANIASRPPKRSGRQRFKRAHVQIKLIPITKKNKEDKK
ncbi:MAG: hypothetical protein ABIH37_04215 [archaeon]